MPLTLRMNGNSPSNLVTASWWNDYYNLLTGSMTDQVVTVKNNIEAAAIAGPPAAPTLALTTGTALGIGTYSYVVTFNSTDGQTAFGTSASITTTSGNQAVNLSNIPTGPTGTISRTIYRTKVGGSVYYFLATISDNVTTTYSDTKTDGNLSSLVVNNPHPSFGGAVMVRDYNYTPQGYIYSDGWASFQGLIIGPFTVNTSVIQVSRALGIETTGGVQLGEFKNNGNLVISGTYGVTGSTTTISASQSFDSFDVAEVYPHDQYYPPGTVVCLGDADAFVQCTHNACPYASIVSRKPAFLAGDIDEAAGNLPLALVGRVNVATQVHVTRKQFLCSDGNGGVRPMQSGETAFSLGYALNDEANGQVGMFIRPCTITAP